MSETAESSRSSIEVETQYRPVLENLQLGRTIGTGMSCKVRIAKDDSGNEYAVKILKSNKKFDELVEAEVETLSMIKHSNIVNMIEYG